MLKNAWNNIVFSTSCFNAWTWLINKTDEKVEFASYSGVELTVKYEPNILPLPAMISVLLYSRAEREWYWTFPLHRKVLVTRPKNYSEEDIDTSSWAHRCNCIFVPTLPWKCASKVAIPFNGNVGNDILLWWIIIFWTLFYSTIILILLLEGFVMLNSS